MIKLKGKRFSGSKEEAEFRAKDAKCTQNDVDRFGIKNLPWWFLGERWTEPGIESYVFSDP